MLRRHSRNALIPVVTIVALDFAAVLGAVITETVYSWKGMGSCSPKANQDTNVVGWLLVAATLVICSTSRPTSTTGTSIRGSAVPDPIHERTDTDFVQEAGPGVQPMGFERRDMGGESAFDIPSEELTEFGVKARSQPRMVSGRFFRHRAAMVSLIILLLMTAAAFLAPHYYKYSYTDLTPAHSDSPSATHWFGTDELGKDTFAKTMRGSTKSLEVALLVTIYATLAGVIVGALAGYYGGWLDSALMRITDLFLIRARAVGRRHRYAGNRATGCRSRW